VATWCSVGQHWQRPHEIWQYPAAAAVRRCCHPHVWVQGMWVLSGCMGDQEGVGAAL
jgi:hypothetical protein